MYGVFTPSKVKPLKTFSCLRSAAAFKDKGISRAVFDLYTRKEITAGTIPRDLEDFFLDHNRDVISNKIDVEIYKIEKNLELH